MNASPSPLLSEIEEGHSGRPIPSPTLAYFQQRLRNRIFALLLEKFATESKSGLTKAALARRIGRTPDVVNRWLASPSNLTIDTLSDLLIGIAAEELAPSTFSPLKQTPSNYNHFSDLASATQLDSSKARPSLHPRSAVEQLGRKPRSYGGAAAAVAIDQSMNRSSGSAR